LPSFKTLAYYGKMDEIYKIMNIGVSIHNMSIEDKKDNNLVILFDPANVG
jgi:hypothetical protein